MRNVTIESTKWDGSPHRQFTAIELGRDHHGTWLWMPEGTVVTKPDTSFRARAGLQLFPPGKWWSAFFVPTGPTGDRWWYTDVILPAIWDEDRVSFVDLDLDVEQIGSGPVTVLDQDEFEANRVAMRYPPRISQRALATAAEMTEWMLSGREPFGVASEIWLERAHANEQNDTDSR